MTYNNIYAMQCNGFSIIINQTLKSYLLLKVIWSSALLQYYWWSYFCENFVLRTFVRGLRTFIRGKLKFLIMVHWIFDDLAIDEYKLSESNILYLCRRIVCYEHNVIGMVKFRRKMIIFWIRSRKSTPKYTKTHIIESLMTSQLMNTGFQKVIFWIM